jgi:flagellar biosynthesis protein FliQ
MLDCWQSFKGRIILLVFLNWIGVTSAASVFGGFILYVRYLEAGRSLTVLGWNIQLESPQMLALSAIVLLGLGVMSSVCLYRTDWMVAHLAIAYQKHAIYRLFRIASDPAYEGWQKLVDGPPSQAMQVFFSTTRGTAIALRRLLSGILPALIFGLSLIFLARTSATLTSLLIPLVLVYLVPLYQANHWVMQQQTDYAKLSRFVRKSISQSLTQTIDTPTKGDHVMAEATQVLETPDYQTVGILFYARKMIGSRLRLVNTIFFITCVIGVFGFFALAPDRETHRWSDLLVYLFALRFAFGGLQQVTSVFGKMSRLAPIYQCYVDFVRNAEQYRRHRQRSPLVNHPLPDPLLCSFPDLKLEGSDRQLTIQPGTPTWVITGGDLTYSNLVKIAGHLEDTLIPPADLISKSVFLTDIQIPPNASHPKSVNPDLQTLEHLFNEPALTPYLKQSGLHTQLTQHYRHCLQPDQHPPPESLNAEAQYLLATWPLLQSSRMVWISVAPLFGLDADFVDALFSTLPNHYLFLVHTDPAKALKRSVLRYHRKRNIGVLVLGNAGIAGCGDVQWLKTYLMPITAYLEQQQELARRLYVGLEDDADEDDD